MRTALAVLALVCLGGLAHAQKRVVVEFTTLNLMREKGIITQAEYDSALRDVADSVGVQGGESTSLLIGKWSTTLYGFTDTELIFDTTQSFGDVPGNIQVARPGTFAGDHPRFTFSVRNSRLGLRLRAPEWHHVRASAQFEMDFNGTSGATSEAATFTSPVFRIRHVFLKVETPIVDVLIGQYWHLFGWQSYYHPNTVAIQGVPGQIYARTIQLRLSKTIKAGPVTIDLAAAMLRPPQRDSATPEGEAGLRLSFDRWTGLMTNGQTGTNILPLSFGVSADVRHFAVAEFSATPKDTRDTTGWGIAADAYIPLVPASKTHRSNALSINAEYGWGYGIADQYTSLTGGVPIATGKLPNPMNVTPAPTYTPNIDQGFLSLDPGGNAHLIQWQSYLVGLNYAFPKLNGRVWVAGNYSHMDSDNAPQFGDPAKLRKSEDWADANLFWDATPALRLGAEYSWFDDHYADGTDAVNHRVNVAAWYIF